MNGLVKLVVIDDYEVEGHFEDGSVRTICYADDITLFEKLVEAASSTLKVPVEYSD